MSHARLTDRQRVGVLLQASGLLSLLDKAGWHLADGWEGACAAPAGLLSLDDAAVRPGRSSRPVQGLLSDLVGRLFGSAGEVAGRGQGRRAVRLLTDRWQQGLVELPADDAVAQLLEIAPFLWEPEFATARAALWGRLPDGQSWIGGPAAFRWRLLGEGREAAEIASLLAGSEVRGLWIKSGHGATGRLPVRQRAAPAPAPAAEERLREASALVSSGRFEAALAAVAGVHSSSARALAARCQILLGRLGAARATLAALEEMPLPLASLVDLAEVAVRVYANSGDPARAEAWVRRALDETAASAGPEALRARLAAACAAWHHRDGESMDRLLEQARPALALPGLAWRWHQAHALRALLTADRADDVVAGLARALGGSRRELARHEAAGLWNDLGLGRAAAGDLAGAERAFRHALRLFSACDGPRRTTLALTNLAEIRLRRGRLDGVWEILERSAAENRSAGNVRALTQDLELQARHELTLGRSEAALALCREALAGLERHGLDWRADPLRYLAARALGWLGRAEQAGQELERVARPERNDLDPEELPAVYALAGDGDEALRRAAGTPFAGLWESLCRGEQPPPAAWEPAALLPPLRAARLVYDAESVLPGASLPSLLRAAVATLRQLGATALWRRLEALDRSAWDCLATYLAAPDGGGEAVAELFSAFPDARLTVTWDDGRERDLVTGRGGPAESSCAVAGGRLTLRAPRDEAALDVFLRFAAREMSRTGVAGPAAPLAAGPDDGLIGDSPPFKAALVRADRLAPGELPILILGESGTGKELVARRIHRLSRRSRRPLLAINCAALSETLLLSELFGHARGSFTGADREHQGVFEAAHGGTVFLDEIGDLPAVAQGMLLRVLQEGEIRRVGESRTRQVDVRILAATHRDLQAMVAAGRFRQDLYYRLRVGNVHLPPLAERGHDVITLAHRFLARAAEDGPAPRLSSAAAAGLLAHRWPGNIRELKNVLAVACALAQDGAIEIEHLDIPKADAATDLYHQQLDALRRRLVASALAQADGRRAEAARRLGVSRQLLSYLMRRFKL